MVVIVHHGLSNMDRRLTHQVFEFLPSTVSRNLSSDKHIVRVWVSLESLTPWRNTTNSSSDLRYLEVRPFSRPRNGMVEGDTSHG